MTSSKFDIGMAVVLAILAVLFLCGKGEGIMEMFSGGMKKRKRTREQERRYERAVGLYFLLLAVLQSLLYFFSTSETVGIVVIVIAVAGLLGLIFYIRHVLQEK